MQDSFLQLFNSSSEGVGLFALGFVLYLLLGMLPALGVLYLIYVLLTLPIRRNERVRIFLDLLELGLKEGRTPETAIADAALSQDRALGKRFQLLAACLRQGMSLGQALDQVPQLLPPQIRAMLKTGERIGDVSKVLPACRLLVRDGVSRVRGALNYLVVLTFVATPFTVAIPLVLRVKVLPRFQQVFQGMFETAQLPAFTRFVFAENSVFVGIQVAFFLLVWIAALIYLGGPRLRDWLEAVLIGETKWIDWLAWRAPWRRRRLQRDFSAMLAALLEAAVPESEAVRLAGESTANALMRRRAEEVRARLKEGVKLPDALHVMDDAGELRWRLANALQRGSGFTRALAGWHETLDAKAFQLEQAAAQVVTTLFVLVNGCLVACFLIAMFLPLIRLINQGTLW